MNFFLAPCLSGDLINRKTKNKVLIYKPSRNTFPDEEKAHDIALRLLPEIGRFLKAYHSACLRNATRNEDDYQQAKNIHRGLPPMPLTTIQEIENTFVTGFFDKYLKNIDIDLSAFPRDKFQDIIFMDNSR